MAAAVSVGAVVLGQLGEGGRVKAYEQVPDTGLGAEAAGDRLMVAARR
ncbi:hypothetical protein ACFYW9_13790 [Streptomyces sp. NPDC002698]